MPSDFNDVVNENPRRMDILGADRTGGDKLVDFSDHEFSCRRHGHVKVAHGHPVVQIAQAVAPISPDEGKVGMQRLFEDIIPAVDDSGFLARREFGPCGRRRKKPAQTGPGGTNPFGQSALRNQFKLDLAL